MDLGHKNGIARGKGIRKRIVSYLVSGLVLLTDVSTSVLYFINGAFVVEKDVASIGHYFVHFDIISVVISTLVILYGSTRKLNAYSVI